MYPISYKTKGKLILDGTGRPYSSVHFVQEKDNNWHSYNFGTMLVDTGAAVTTINKETADDNGYPVIKSGWPVLMGFTDLARVLHDLMKLGKTESEAKDYLRFL